MAKREEDICAKRGDAPRLSGSSHLVVVEMVCWDSGAGFSPA
jgi:hypothetical protein